MKKLLITIAAIVSISVSSFGYTHKVSGWGPDFSFTEHYYNIDAQSVYYSYVAWRTGSVTNYQNFVDAGANVIYSDGWTFNLHAESKVAHQRTAYNGYVPQHEDRWNPGQFAYVASSIIYLKAPLKGDFAYVYYSW